jgi:hypothetical protein
VVDYCFAVSALVLILVEPFVSIAGTLPCIGFHKAISNIAGVAYRIIQAEQTSNDSCAWILDTFSSIGVVFIYTFGALCFACALQTVV